MRKKRNGGLKGRIGVHSATKKKRRTKKEGGKEANSFKVKVEREKKGGCVRELRRKQASFSLTRGVGSYIPEQRGERTLRRE